METINTFLIDTKRTIVVEYKYNAWGKLLAVTGSMASTLGRQNPIRYRGYEYDEESGLYYLRSRYYNPDTGRFISADSVMGRVGEVLSHNLYCYCGNNPVMFEDKEGCEYTYSAKDFLVDIPGILILHHYLFGNGKDYIIQNNDLWTFYMKGTKICHEFDKCAGESLSDYAYSLVYDYGLDLCNGESLDFDVTTSAEIENGESIKGMHYLHGTNSKVGGFRVYGTVNMEYGYRIYKYTCEWNDIIDPNYQYSSDMAKVNIAYKIPFANPTDYTIKISWNETRVDNINGVSRY